ncbi:MAG: hypothetical protein IKD50_07775 [Clostridia bacterium]|nr:hypothetical protein [Clostridia bacterium]
MTRKNWSVKLAAFLAAAALMLNASLVNIEFLNTSARAEEETALPIAEEAVPQVIEAEEETVPQAAEEAAPQATETEEEAVPETESEPESAAEPEDHREEAQPEAVAGDDNDETDDDPEWIDDNERTDDPEEEEDLIVIEDDDAGSVSEGILEPFNNPELYEQEAFVSTAEIRLMNEGMLNYGDEIILKADVRDVNMSYRLVWEANDNDGHGWFTVGSGDEYRFILDPENAAREYRVEIFAAD